jgi:xanthine dehydrogenase accessory factor
MDIWKFIQQKLEEGQAVMLMLVVHSIGSSPGRQGFKMAVSSDHEIFGSIGGGIMEHKLVEKSKHDLLNGNSEIECVKQFHDKEHAKNQSGMICSGEQTIVFLPIHDAIKNVITKIEHANKAEETGCLIINPQGLNFEKKDVEKRIAFEFKNENDWQYHEILNKPFVAHIIGAGHVGLALSEILHFLGFRIKIYDDRKNLNTLEVNTYVQEKNIIDYTKINESIHSSEDDYMIIMSFGYRNDKEIYLQLIERDFAYIGMMGSVEKIKNLKQELSDMDVPKEKLKKLKAPIGINISSKTPKEIAISIAAEIIKEKNKQFSSARKCNLK